MCCEWTGEARKCHQLACVWHKCQKEPKKKKKTATFSGSFSLDSVLRRSRATTTVKFVLIIFIKHSFLNSPPFCLRSIGLKKLKSSGYFHYITFLPPCIQIYINILSNKVQRLQLSFSLHHSFCIY